MGLPIAIYHQQHQVIACTYEHTSANMQVSAAVPLVWTKFKVLKTNPSKLTECTVNHFPVVWFIQASMRALLGSPSLPWGVIPTRYVTGMTISDIRLDWRRVTSAHSVPSTPYPLLSFYWFESSYRRPFLYLVPFNAWAKVKICDLVLHIRNSR